MPGSADNSCGSADGILGGVLEGGGGVRHGLFGNGPPGLLSAELVAGAGAGEG